MKKLRSLAVALIGVSAFFTVSAFKSESGSPKQVVVQQHFRPVLVNCLTPAGQVYAFRNNCVAQLNSLCVATVCPGPPVAANRRAVLINCIRNGVVYAFANNCVVQNGSVCRPTTCP